MANKIIPKRSSVSGKVPATTDLDVGEIAVNLTDRKIYTKDSGGTVVQLGGGAGSGDVVGPNSSTDNAIARFDLATGKLIQNSSATIDDSGNLTATSNKASGTAANKMPVGTTAQRPTGEAGLYRFNSTTGAPEWYDPLSGAWLGFSQTPYQIEYLVIGGGGGGGYGRAATGAGGGGGAGGYRSSVTGETSGGGAAAESKITVVNGQSFTVTVGAGGATQAAGGSSALGTITAVGGGQGATGPGSGFAGGSGGGAAASGTGGAGTSGQGYRGGNQAGAAPGTGGGGAGGQGQDINTPNYYPGGNGGASKSSSITGTSVAYAGGGGGGAYGQYGGGTNGGGGAGNGGGYSGGGGAATANTGSGGGGGAGDNGTTAAGGAGGSGVVIIRYAGAQRGTGGTVTSAGGYTIHTFTSSGTFAA